MNAGRRFLAPYILDFRRISSVLRDFVFEPSMQCDTGSSTAATVVIFSSRSSQIPCMLAAWIGIIPRYLQISTYYEYMQ